MKVLQNFFYCLILSASQTPVYAVNCSELMTVARAKAQDQNLESVKDLAMNSSNFRERASAASAVLAAYGIPENSSGLSMARNLISSPTSWCRWWGYAFLGYLDLAQVRDTSSKQDLAKGLKDPEEDVRRSVVQSMGVYSDEDLIAILFKTFTDDKSPVVRERAACVLSHAGLYTKERRMKMVPIFISCLKNPKLDEQTKNWSVQALNYITGVNYGKDIKQWEDWIKKK